MVSAAKRLASVLRSIRVRLEKGRSARVLTGIGLVLVVVLWIGMMYLLRENDRGLLHGGIVDEVRSIKDGLFGNVTSLSGGTGLRAEDQAEAVRGMMRHAWDSYVKYAWGQDELRPVAKTGKATFGGCTGVTILDAIDTLYIMDLKDRYQKARSWIHDSLNFSCVNSYVSHFETTIRSLGGLMTMYHLTGEKRYLEQAEDLGGRLLPCLKDGDDQVIPGGSVNLKRRSCRASSNLAEAGTIQMEWRALSMATDIPALKNGRVQVEKTMLALIHSLPGDEIPGSSPYDMGQGKVGFNGEITMAGNADSFFEYLVKMHVQGGSNPGEGHYRHAFNELMKLTIRTLVRNDGGMYRVIHLRPTQDQMDHLTCFLPGSLALAVHAKESMLTETEKAEFMKVAAGLTETCYMMYHLSPSGLAPEIITWRGEKFIGPRVRNNIQRPEAVEAIFYMWRFTHDPKYRAWAWEIFTSMERVMKTEGGYSGLVDAWQAQPRLNNEMSSFFLAETIKYLYLTFTEDSVIPLDQWVFNTESHPLRIDPRLGQNPIKAT